MNIREAVSSKLVQWFPGTAAVVRNATVSQLEDQVWHLEESITRLQLELENEGYRRLSQQSEHEFDRRHLEDLCKVTVAMALKNPIIGRAVNVQADYIFGRGVKFVAAHPMIQAVLDEHVKYHRNQQVLYSHDAMSRQERELQLKGNLFFGLFTNSRTGRVTVRDIDTSEVADIIRNPHDYHDEWFIKRTYTDYDDNGTSISRIVYHPAIGVTLQTGAYVPANEEAGEIDWGAPVLHVAFNRYGRMKFGVPEVYSSIDWALAYKRFLEDWSSIMRSFARMAMKITGLAGKKQAAAAKSKLQTSVSLSNPLETNPSPTGAATGLFGKGVDAEPVKTAGATTPAKEGQPLLNMAAAGLGLPNAFFGDTSASDATTSSLDRPTELKMVARQRLWIMIFTIILEYVLMQAAKCSGGLLAEQGAEVKTEVDPFSDEQSIRIVMPNNDDDNYGAVGQPVNIQFSVKFPELLERNVTDRVRALVNALTLFGKPLTDIIPDKRLVCRLLLEALNYENIDQMMPDFIKMWEKNMEAEDDGKPVDAIIVPPAPVAKPGGAAEDPSQGGDVGANG